MSKIEFHEIGKKWSNIGYMGIYMWKNELEKEKKISWDIGEV